MKFNDFVNGYVQNDALKKAWGVNSNNDSKKRTKSPRKVKDDYEEKILNDIFSQGDRVEKLLQDFLSKQDKQVGVFKKIKESEINSSPIKKKADYNEKIEESIKEEKKIIGGYKNINDDEGLKNKFVDFFGKIPVGEVFHKDNAFYRLNKNGAFKKIIKRTYVPKKKNVTFKEEDKKKMEEEIINTQVEESDKNEENIEEK